MDAKNEYVGTPRAFNNRENVHAGDKAEVYFKEFDAADKREREYYTGVREAQVEVDILERRRGETQKSRIDNKETVDEKLRVMATDNMRNKIDEEDW